VEGAERGVEKIDVTALAGDEVGWTLLGTLFLRAWESRQEHPILGDRWAAEALERIEHDPAALRRRTRPESNQYLVALRAGLLDRWCAAFLARHPDAVVLHLGCGLDSRAFRLAPPAPALWFDIDLPEVVVVRRRLYADGDRYRMVGASVTDPGWLDDVPDDRPVLVVAEGLLMYLTEDEVRRLLVGLADRFGYGELLFDVVAPWLARMGGPTHWGIVRGRRIEAWDPHLHLLEQLPLGTGYERIPNRNYRTIYRLGDRIPFWRHMLQALRFGIGPPT
jgi:O-methyltransferase involved in polyketide biosynthesis